MRAAAAPVSNVFFIGCMYCLFVLLAIVPAATATAVHGANIAILSSGGPSPFAPCAPPVVPAASFWRHNGLCLSVLRVLQVFLSITYILFFCFLCTRWRAAPRRHMQGLKAGTPPSAPHRPATGAPSPRDGALNAGRWGTGGKGLPGRGKRRAAFFLFWLHVKAFVFSFLMMFNPCWRAVLLFLYTFAFVIIQLSLPAQQTAGLPPG